MRLKKPFSRILCILLLVALLLPSFVGCKPDDTTQDPPIDQPEELIQFIENGVVTYTVVRPEAGAQEVIKSAVAICSAIKAKTGVKSVPIAEDYVNRGESVPTDTLEILVGLTNREESIAAHAQLAENEYIIAIVNNRLVIIGYDDATTVAAVEYFVTNILETSASDGAFALSPSLALKNTYTPPVVDPPILPDGTTYPAQNKPTVSPANYVKPTYTLKDGMYVQHYEGFELGGVKTTFQANTLFSEVYNIHTDSVMVYSSNDPNFISWYKSGDYVVDMMIAINRGGKDYLDRDKSNYDDIQKDSGGNYIVHTADVQWYMVPSEDWIEYAWEVLLKPVVEKYHPQSIALEEPEMWIRSGYSEAFKQEWENYYDEPWQAPNSSAAANLKANLLKTYLFERILVELSSRIKELSPGTQVYIASHSTVNYTAWAINAGLNTYLATDAIDGVIGQTWADTHNSAFAYNGASVRDNFTNAFIEYCSYVDSVEGTNFYALADPMADGKSYVEADLQYIYRQSVAAQLMQPEISRFQVLPWVQRAYANVSADYRTVQSQIFEMLNNIGGQEITMSAGTPGIAYLASDSLSWMNAGSGWALSTANGMYGICAPLVRDGIPVKMKAMEQIYTAKDLEGVNLLVVSFDSSVPLSEEVNIAIADWVKAGGTMLYVGGHNQYWNIDDYFFWAEDVTPLDNLFGHLGLDVTVKTTSPTLTATLTSPDSALMEIVDGIRVPASYTNYTVSFEGAENPILRSGSTVLGFTEDVGRGSVVVIGLPSALYSGFEGGSSLMRALTEYALQFTEYEYVSTPVMVTNRGNYTIAHSFGKDEYLAGAYIDLFDSNLSVLQDPDIPENDSLILYNIDNIKLDVPRLGYTSGQVLSLSEKADQTVIKMTSAGNTNLSIRLLAPNNCYPSSITVTGEDGKTYPVLGYFWDNDSASCLIKIDGNHESVTLTVTWGDEKVDLGVSSKVFVEETYKTNQNDNEDADFIEPETTAAANHGVRFCDNSLQLIYKFDLWDYDTPLFRFHISQNYILEVSADKKNWTIIADYSQGGTRDRVVNGANAEVFTVDPADYDLDDVMYIRLRNTESVGGFGGAISAFSIRHLVESEGDFDEITAPTNRLDGVNNTSDIQDTIKRSGSAEEKKYLISTDPQTGIGTYRRTIKTTNANEDFEFISFNTAGSTDSLRFCDGDRQIIYMFDVSGMLTADFAFSIFQNYILEVSADGKSWEIVADYSKGGTVPHITTGQNKTTIHIDPFDYSCDESGMCYVRLRNSDTSKGWGGSITQITLNYTRKVK